MYNNYFDYDFWKNINSILLHRPPCYESWFVQQTILYRMHLRDNIPYQYEFLYGSTSRITHPVLQVQIASYKDMLVSEQKLLQMLKRPEGLVVKPVLKATPTTTKMLVEKRISPLLANQSQQAQQGLLTNSTKNGTGRFRDVLLNNKTWPNSTSYKENNVTKINKTKKQQNLEKVRERLEEIRQSLQHMENAATIETVIGSISIFACVVCLILYRVLRIEEKTKFYLHKNLFIAWILSYGLQIIGNYLSEKFQKYKDFCTTYLVVNQYILLSFFSWMSLEGFNLFMVLAFVFQARMVKKCFFALAGWGLPLCIVATEVGVFFDSFKENKSCVGLEKNDWLFKGPMGFFLSVNGLFFCAIGFVLLKSISRSGKYTTKTSKARATGKAFLVLLPILGLTFFLGYGVENRAIMYIYSIVNPLMGILLCTFHFFLDKEVQSAFHDYKRKREAKRGVVGDKNSTNLTKLSSKSVQLENYQDSKVHQEN